MSSMPSLMTMEDDELIKWIVSGKAKEYVIEKLKQASPILMAGHYVRFELEEEDMEFYLQKAKEELRETPEVIAQSIKELKELFAGEANFRYVDTDDYCKIFLRPCKWYARSAFSLIKRYFRFCQNYPHIFTNILPSQQKASLCSFLTYPMPLRNTDGGRIFIVEVGNRWKPKEISLNQLFQAMVLCTLAAMFEPKTQIAGGHVIIDFEGFSLSQVTYFSPSFAKMLTDFVQKAVPIRLKSVHIINQPFIFNMVFAMFKPFLEEKYRKRIHFHGTNRESLLTFIDKSVLLKRHGGELEVTETSFGENFWRYFCVFDEIINAYMKLGY